MGILDKYKYEGYSPDEMPISYSSRNLSIKISKKELLVKLAEWLAIDHGETRSQYEGYLNDAQELMDYLTVLGYKYDGKQK